MLRDEFKIKEDVKMRARLPDFDDFLGIDLANEGGLATVAKRVYGGFCKTITANS